MRVKLSLLFYAICIHDSCYCLLYVLTDGMLTIQADGGVNTKINYAVIPNPFSDHLSVQLLPELKGKLFISVQDLVGNTYYRTNQEKQPTSIYLDLASVDFKAGIYLVIITDDKGFKQVTKVVKR